MAVAAFRGHGWMTCERGAVLPGEELGSITHMPCETYDKVYVKLAKANLYARRRDELSTPDLEVWDVAQRWRVTLAPGKIAGTWTWVSIEHGSVEEPMVRAIVEELAALRAV